MGCCQELKKGPSNNSAENLNFKLKSKTSINACLKYPFEIINTDAFACYRGKGIMTDKLSEKDQELVKHQIIDFLEYENNSFTILDYKKSIVLKIYLIRISSLLL